MGEYVTESFTKLHYRPLSRKFFGQIEIQLSDVYGDGVKFQWGKVIATLHVRKRKVRQHSA